MYYLFKDDILGYRNGYIQAKLKSHFDLAIHSKWNVGKNLQPYSGQVAGFQFEVRSDVPHPDNYFTGANLDLYSPRLLAIFESIAHLKYETFDTEILERRTGKKVLDDYRVFRLLEIFPLIDPERSALSHEDIELSATFYEGAMEKAPALFRDYNFSPFVFISSELKGLLENQGITGCVFEPLEKYMAKMTRVNRIVKKKPNPDAAEN